MVFFATSVFILISLNDVDLGHILIPNCKILFLWLLAASGKQVLIGLFQRCLSGLYGGYTGVIQRCLSGLYGFSFDSVSLLGTAISCVTDS